jgi:hypothetical protein
MSRNNADLGKGVPWKHLTYVFAELLFFQVIEAYPRCNPIPSALPPSNPSQTGLRILLNGI